MIHLKKLVLWFLCATSVIAVGKPNIILLMTDDQGYGDIAAHGNPQVQTPEMDRLHSQSVRLTDFHVDPTCAPTRGALMTGKYPHRARVWHTVRGGNHLRKTEVTMADVFKHNGYDTALFGKWHLGANYPYRPMDRGFDEWLGSGDGGPGTSDCWFWNDRVNDTYWHNGEREFREGYNPDVFYGAAIDYIKDRESEKPFFIYLPTYAAHKPCTLPDEKLAQKYLDIGVPIERALFYAMIERVDQNIGKLRKALDKEGVADNTILIFMTDNGSTHGRTSFNAGMSGGKGSALDGGHRVPCFIHWPDGSIGKPRDVDTLCAHIDLLPTLTELCGMELPKPVDFDGRSLVPLFQGLENKWVERTLFVEGQRAAEYKKGARSTVMTEEWRLIGLKQLHNIQKDPAQKEDVAAQHPEVVERLKGKFDEYWERVTPDDRTFPAPIVGTIHDEEILLGISERRDGKGFEHGFCATGRPAEGVWHIDVAEAGVYEFEVRRWPREASAPFTGIPRVTKTVDSWHKVPVTHCIYGNTFVPMPIKTISLDVGKFSEKRNVTASDEALVFNVELPRGRVEVDADFLDAAGESLTKAYYVYVRKRGES